MYYLVIFKVYDYLDNMLKQRCEYTSNFNIDSCSNMSPESQFFKHKFYPYTCSWETHAGLLSRRYVNPASLNLSEMRNHRVEWIN